MSQLSSIKSSTYKLKFLLTIQIFLILIYQTNSYPSACPTDCQLLDEPLIKREFIQASISKQTYQQIKCNNTYNIAGFQSSTLSILRPLYSLLQLESFAIINCVLNFKINIIIDQVNSTGTFYRSYIYFSQTNINLVRSYVLFFSKELQSKNYFYTGLLEFNQLISFKNNNPLRQQRRIEISQVFNQYAQLKLSNAYTVIAYTVGINVYRSQNSAQSLGIQTSLSLNNLNQFQLSLTAKNNNWAASSTPLYFKSIIMSILIYNSTYLLQTQFYIENRFQSMAINGTASSSFGYNIPSNNYFIGISYFRSENNDKFGFKIDASIDTSNQKLLNYSYSSQDITNEIGFFIFGKISTITNNSITNCSNGQYLSNAIKYGAQTCAQCHITCLTCSDYLVCSSCDINSHRILNLSTNLCQPDKLYYQTNLGVIGQCNASACVQCSYDANNCTNCQNKYYLQFVGPSYTCNSCIKYGADCIQCTFEKCLLCNGSTGSFKPIDNQCSQSNSICGDGIWNSQTNEQCEVPINNSGNQTITGCSDCKISDGFECHLSPQNPNISQCLYNKQIKIYLKSLSKLQFSNDLEMKLYLTSTIYFDSINNLNQTLSFSSEDLDDETLKSIKYSYSSSNQQLILSMNYDSENILEKTLTVHYNLNNLNQTILKYYQSISANIICSHNSLNQAYYLLSFPNLINEKAKSFSKIITFISIIVLIVIFLGYFGGKLIVLEIIAIVQITYLGLLLIDRYSPMYLALTRLSIVGGSILSEQTTVPLLNTLSLNTSVIKNVNYQFTFFLLFITGGTVLLLLSKSPSEIKYKKQFLFIGANFLIQYSLYSLLILSYLVATSIGLQIYYELINKKDYQIQIAIPSMLIGILFIIGIAIYMSYYVKYRIYFGEFHRSFKRYYIQQKFFVIYLVQKLLIFLLLGLLHNIFQFTGFLLASIELLMMIFIVMKQPFHKFYENVRLILNSSYIIFVLVLYNIIKIKQSNIDIINTDVWLSNAIIALIGYIFGFFLLYYLIEFIKQIIICFERLLNIKEIYLRFHGLDEKQLQNLKTKISTSSNKQLQEKEEEKIWEIKNLFQGPKMVTLTREQQKLWDDILKIKTKNDRKKLQNHKYPKNLELKSIEHLKQTKQMKKIDNEIRRRLKQKQKRFLDNSNDIMHYRDEDDELLSLSDMDERGDRKQYRRENKQWQEEENFEDKQTNFGKKRSKNMLSKSNNFKIFSNRQNQSQIYKQLSNKKNLKNMLLMDHWQQIDEHAQMYKMLQKYQKEEEQKEKESNQNDDQNDVDELTNIQKSTKTLQKNPFLDYHKEQVEKQINEILNENIGNQKINQKN